MISYENVRPQVHRFHPLSYFNKELRKKIRKIFNSIVKVRNKIEIKKKQKK